MARLSKQDRACFYNKCTPSIIHYFTNPLIHRWINLHSTASWPIHLPNIPLFKCDKHTTLRIKFPAWGIWEIHSNHGWPWTGFFQSVHFSSHLNCLFSPLLVLSWETLSTNLILNPLAQHLRLGLAFSLLTSAKLAFVFICSASFVPLLRRNHFTLSPLLSPFVSTPSPVIWFHHFLAPRVEVKSIVQI
jgi:hypothetical protein